MTNAADLDRPRRPAAGYAEARERLRTLEALDGASRVALNPVSHTRFLTPVSGASTRRVLVYFHGLTNSPQSFVPLAERFVAGGDAVLIPRLPRHGYADGLNTDQAGLTAEALVDTAAEAIDLAAGLAEEVLVAGISLGGVLAAWAAQYRPVTRAVVIAPSIGLPIVPGALNRALIAAALALPNAFVWWDPRRRADLPGPPYAYPRYSTHALARVQRLGFAIVAAARHTPPAAAETWAVTNGADLAVNNGDVDTLVRHWRRSRSGRGCARIETFRFPRRLRLFHDIVDPLQPYQQVSLTHPVLARIIGEGTAPDPASLRRCAEGGW
ncbi:MAG: alpha/beta fold hydrolase [Chloroflexota bacterium]|nr:alpha/beta fold hydrolase [Chloroflexota bacterium]